MAKKQNKTGVLTPPWPRQGKCGATGRNCCKGSRQSTLTLSPAALSLPGPDPRQAAPRPPSLHRLGLCREPRDQGQWYILPSPYRDESGVVPRQGINVGKRWSPPVLQPLLLFLVIYAIFFAVPVMLLWYMMPSWENPFLHIHEFIF